MQFILQRRKQPQNDLISHLISADLDGEPLSDKQLIGFCGLLIVAGHVTTENVIGNSFLSLKEFPHILPRLLENKALLPDFIEEVIRLRPSIQRVTRYTAVESEIGGKTIPAGEKVYAWIGSANRDEKKFRNADQIDLGRKPNQHLSFGQGSHYCLGAPLARLEAKIALSHFFEQVPAWRFTEDQEPNLVPSPVFHGVDRLLVEF
nr:cytochrome P450 [Bacillus velezensis]